MTNLRSRNDSRNAKGETSAKAYQRNARDIQALLSYLAEALPTTDSPPGGSTGINWTDVADAQHARERLAEIAAGLHLTAQNDSEEQAHREIEEIINDLTIEAAARETDSIACNGGHARHPGNYGTCACPPNGTSR